MNVHSLRAVSSGWDTNSWLWTSKVDPQTSVSSKYSAPNLPTERKIRRFPLEVYRYFVRLIWSWSGALIESKIVHCNSKIFGLHTLKFCAFLCPLLSPILITSIRSLYIPCQLFSSMRLYPLLFLLRNPPQYMFCKVHLHDTVVSSWSMATHQTRSRHLGEHPGDSQLYCDYSRGNRWIGQTFSLNLRT